MMHVGPTRIAGFYPLFLRSDPYSWLITEGARRRWCGSCRAASEYEPVLLWSAPADDERDMHAEVATSGSAAR